MKKPAFLLGFLCLTLFFACKSDAPPQEEETPVFTNPLPGAWKMTAYLPEDSAAMQVPDFEQYKFYTGEHFFFVTFDDEADTLIMTAGGTYSVVQDTFTETILYATWDTTITDEWYSFTYRVADGTFQQQGPVATYDPESDWKNAEEYAYVGLAIDTAGTVGSPSGLWRSTRVAYRDDEEPHPLENGDVIYKLITPTHFYVTTFQPDEGRFRGGVFGTWEIKDGKYVENIIVATWNPEMVGMEIPYDYSVGDGKFEQKAMVTIGDETGKMEEYYERVE